MGARGVSAAQAGINTTGQNIANANTEGYSRQRVNQQSASPLVSTDGIYGQGVEIVSVERLRDRFLESQIRDSRSDTKFNEQLDNIYQQLETIINDPLASISDTLDNSSSSGLNNLMSRFFQSMNDLSLNPEAPEVRSAAIESALSLSQTFNTVGEQMRGLRSDLNSQASRLVDEVNRMTSEIANLNKRIAVSEVGGTVSANDLRDQRDVLLSQLSEIIPITTEEQSNGAIDVNLAGERIVDGVNSREILKESTESPDQLEIFRLRIDELGLDVKDDLVRGGELGAVLQARDEILPYFQDEIDTLARGVMYEVNKIHSSSVGLDGYVEVDSHFDIPGGSTAPDTIRTLEDVFNDPKLKSDAALGDYPYNVQDGSFTIRVANEDNETRDTYNVQVNTDDNLYEIAERIDRSDGIVGSVRSALTFDPVFVERATPTFGATAAEITAGTGIGALASAVGTPISETPGAYTLQIDVRKTGGSLVDADPSTPDVDPIIVNFDDTMTLNQLANAIQNASNQTVRAVVAPSKDDPTISVLQLSAINESESFSIRNDTSGIMQAFNYPVTDPTIPLAGGVTDSAAGKFFGRSDTSFLGGGTPAFSPSFPGPPPSVVSAGSFELVVLDNNNVPTISTITIQPGTVETIDDVIAEIEAADPNLSASVNANNELVITSSNNRQFFFQNDNTGLI
ncbi:flagellar hook-associated protein FlgK, partial [bacterium]|nr:flagellar hook-associated protein FlgK [bacterium]